MLVNAPCINITTPSDVAEVISTIVSKELTHDQHKEHFWVIGVDSRNAIKYVDLVSIGTLDQVIVHPRDVFSYAVTEGIKSLFIVHNHPSGDPAPSKEDTLTTEKLSAGGKLLEIPVIDHVIVGNTGSYFSYMEAGLL